MGHKLSIRKTDMARCSCSCECVKQWASKNKLLLWTMFAIVAGIVVGLCLRLTDLNYDAVVWLNIWGELFLRMLKMIILPLITCCLVVGISDVESGVMGRLGLATLCYVFSTQLVGVCVGVVLAILIHPGQILSSDAPSVTQVISYTDVATDFLRNLFPDNIVQACTEHVYTLRTTAVDAIQEYNATVLNGSGLNDTMATTRELLYRDGTNTMGIVIFSILLGAGIHAGGQRTKPLLSFFEAFNVTIFHIMDIILLYSPLGIFSLIAGALVQVDHLADALQSMAMFIITVTVGLFVHQMILLPLIYLVLTKKNPFRLLLLMLDAILAGMAPPSSAVALPYLLRRSDNTLKIDSRISKFVLPVFTTINRDGSALFIGVAAVFVAQTYGISLGAAQYTTIVLMITLLSAAVAAVPSSSILVLIMVASTVSIPINARLGLLMTVEWLLDRLRTGTNLCSNSFGLAVIAHWCTSMVQRPENGVIPDYDEEKPAAEELLPLNTITSTTG